MGCFGLFGLEHGIPLAEDISGAGWPEDSPCFEVPLVGKIFPPTIVFVDDLDDLHLTRLNSSAFLLMMVRSFSSFLMVLLIFSSSSSRKEYTEVSFILTKTESRTKVHRLPAYPLAKTRSGMMN
jgi:hypothetical protein